MGVGYVFNKSATFLTNTPVTQGAGSKDAYTTLCTRQGRYRKLSGSRGFSYGEIVEDNRWELIVFYESTLSALKVNDKVRVDSKTHTIATIELIDEVKLYYKIILNEQKNG